MKNILFTIFVLSVLLVPNSLTVQAYTSQSEIQTKEEKMILINQLLAQVKMLQTQLEILIKEESAKYAPITISDYTRGKENARVQILTFTDLECPFCKMFHTTLNSILEKNTDVSVTYRHFPLEQLYPNATELAIAAECAGQIGGDRAFWNVVDAMFDSRSINDRTDMKKVPSFLKKVGVSSESFEKCVSGQVAENAVRADIADGLARGVMGTPQSYVFADGKLIGEINGAQPLTNVQSMISGSRK